MDPYETDFTVTICLCNHLTSFAGMYVAPNPLPPLTLALLKTGYAAIVLVAVILSLSLLVLVMARRRDKIDLTMVRAYFFKIQDSIIYFTIVNIYKNKCNIAQGSSP